MEESEREIETSNCINLGDLDNEPNTVLKYEGSSSQPRLESNLMTEEVVAFNNQDAYTQYHITQGNSVVIRSNFLSSSQSNSNVFNFNQNNNLITLPKTTATQS